MGAKEKANIFTTNHVFNEGSYESVERSLGCGMSGSRVRGKGGREEKQRGHKRSITMKNGVISRCLLAPALSSLFGNGTFPFLSSPLLSLQARRGFSGIIGPRQNGEGTLHCIWQCRYGP